MLSRVGLAVAMLYFACAAFTQEANFGLSVPVTLSAGGMDSQRLELSNPSNSPAAFGLRAMFYPTLRLGQHWFSYGALEFRLKPYFYYDAFDPTREVEANLIQGYLGYSWKAGGTSFVIKAGKLASAFGSFPLRYDDLDNPLLDQPLSYIQELPLPSNQLLCGTADLLKQYYGYVRGSCGGVAGAGTNLTPATLYGLPGAQIEAASRRFDARLQITSGSPANPQGSSRFGGYAQWAAGGGYTIRQGFRVGGSAFSGPYLDPVVSSFLPRGATVRDFPATGLGLDAQWARGRFSAYGEWQHFRFELPSFVEPPSFNSGYGEVKSILTPRIYLAARGGWLQSGRVMDANGVRSSNFAPLLRTYEAGGGFWLNRRQLLKASYSWLQIAGQPGSRFNVYGVELVTHLTPPALAFR